MDLVSNFLTRGENSNREQFRSVLNSNSAVECEKTLGNAGSLTSEELDRQVSEK